jgi:hypothetical protein
MDDRKMQIIQDLMDQLQEELKPSGDELGERLGRPKIEVAQMDGDIGIQALRWKPVKRVKWAKWVKIRIKKWMTPRKKAFVAD